MNTRILHEGRHPLYENAIDCLREGMRLYLLEDERETKHAVLHVFRSIELLLKEVLRREHRLLIYRNLDKQITPDSQTVGLKETLVRLGHLGIKASKEDEETLFDLKKFRNRIEHHEYRPQEEHRTRMAEALKIIYRIMPLHLRETLEEALDDAATYRAIRQAILDHSERMKEALAEIDWDTMRNKEVPPLANCPECGNETVMVATEKGHFCLYCHQAVELERCQNCLGYFNPTEMWDEEDCEGCHWAFMDRLERE